MWFMYGPDDKKLFCVDELYVTIVNRFIRNFPQFYVARG